MISGEQLRAARSLLRWDQSTLAVAADVSVETIKRLEKVKGPLFTATGTTLHAITNALAARGIEFVNDVRGEGVVKLKGDQP
jgi:transcriptional regulator with XRE-family HTH domain